MPDGLHWAPEFLRRIKLQAPTVSSSLLDNTPSLLLSLPVSRPLSPTRVFWDPFPHQLLVLGSLTLILVLGERAKDLWEMFLHQCPSIVLRARKASYDNTPTGDGLKRRKPRAGGLRRPLPHPSPIK